MIVAETSRSQIEDVMSEVGCQKDFGCYRSGFETVCRVRNHGPGEFLECLDEDARNCQFSLFFGDAVSCLCPVRIFVTTELNK
ncbi:MAG: hypothetical protein ACYTEL_15255 [Planctomycetota bacterium]|jgi:hypothetical protein